MDCLLLILDGMFPRLGVLFVWLARPAIFSAAFDGSWFWPLLGILFLPFTTLMYVILWWSGGLVRVDWFWLLLAFLLDIGTIASSAYANHNRLGTPATAQSEEANWLRSGQSTTIGASQFREHDDTTSHTEEAKLSGYLW